MTDFYFTCTLRVQNLLVQNCRLNKYLQLSVSIFLKYIWVVFTLARSMLIICLYLQQLAVGNSSYVYVHGEKYYLLLVTLEFCCECTTR